MSSESDDALVAEAADAAAALFQGGAPRTYHEIWRRSGDLLRARLPSALDALCARGVLTPTGAGSWARTEAAAGPTPIPSPRPRRPPVWEDVLARRLEGFGLRPARGRVVDGRALGMAFTAFAAKLDVEVVARFESELPSQRARNVARDARLRAEGWHVLRIPDADAAADPDGCCRRIAEVWQRIKEGEIAL